MCNPPDQPINCHGTALEFAVEFGRRVNRHDLNTVRGLCELELMLLEREKQPSPALADVADVKTVCDFIDAHKPELGMSNTDTLCHIAYKHEQQINAILTTRLGPGEFKRLTHARLDGFDVDRCEGVDCRVGARFDLLTAKFNQMQMQVKELEVAIKGLGWEQAHGAGYCFCEPLEDDQRDGHEPHCEDARSALDKGAEDGN